MRYKVKGYFEEERMKGFVVKHTMSQEHDTALDTSDAISLFIKSYDSACCHHFHLEVVEP